MIKLIIEIISSSLKLGKSELVFFFFLLILSTAIEIFGISLIIPLVSTLTDTSEITKYSEFLNINFLNFELKTKKDIINYISLLILFGFTLKYLITIVIEYLLINYTRNWEIKMIMKLLDSHISSPWLKAITSQEHLLKNILVNIPTFISEGITSVLNIFKNILILIGIFIFLIYQEGALVLVTLFLLILIFYFLLKNFKNYLMKLSNEFGEYISIKYALHDEIKNGLREIKILNLRNFFLKSFFSNETQLKRVDVIRQLLSIMPKIIIEYTLLIGFLFIIYLNSEKPAQILPLLGLLSFIVYRSQPILSSLVSTFTTIQLHTNQIREGIAVINSGNEIKKININYNTTNNYDKNLTINSNSNSVIELKDLSFSYNLEKSRQIFSKSDLSLKFGKIYALSGNNGTGKSTFADLLSGLIEPSSGEILYNGKNIQFFSKKWMNSISYLSQNFFLFNDTIKNNITLTSKNEKNSFDNDQYQKALEAVNLKAELLKFDNYDDTILRESGKKLSGGQKQRIAIARLIYRNSNIIILDEPTAHLDKESIDVLFKMLQRIKKDKLILIISHDQEILKKSDKIIKIDNRKINFLNNE